MFKRKLVTISVLVAVLCFAVGTSYANTTVKVYVDGKEIIGDTPAQIINDRTMVPVSFVAEALGAKVAWDQATNSVIITSKPEQQQLNLMKLNGEPTTWPYWYENGVLYMEYRNLQGMLKLLNPHPTYLVHYFTSSNTLQLAGRNYENIPCLDKGDFRVLSLTYLQSKKEINFDWDDKTGNLVIKPI